MPRSKHAWIVAMLSASLIPGLVMPAIGQQPKATSEICRPVLARGRYCMVFCIPHAPREVDCIPHAPREVESDIPAVKLSQEPHAEREEYD